MINFVGTGCGAVDLITLRGKRLIEEADIIIYAGSLINKELLNFSKKDCVLYNSALMNLDEIMNVMIEGEKNNKKVVRLHSGDPSIYGSICEQMQILDDNNISYEICPGVSALSGAASSLKKEYTPAEVSQTVIITRVEGKTKVPELENVASLAKHHSSMVFFLSTGLLNKLTKELIKGGFSPSDPASIVYKATWPDEIIINCTIEELEKKALENNITKTALICVGDFLKGKGSKSKLYSKDFTTEFRNGSKK